MTGELTDAEHGVIATALICRGDVYAAVAQIVAEREKQAAREALLAAADVVGPFHGAVLVGPVGDAFCTGWDAALAAVRELANRQAGE